MAKFLLNYHGGKLADTPDGQAKAMEAWNTWFGQLGSALIDGGNPVGATKTVTSGGVSDGATGASTGYSIIEVNSIDEAVKASQMCPVLAGGGSVEVGQLLDIISRKSGEIPERAVGPPAARSFCFGGMDAAVTIRDLMTTGDDSVAARAALRASDPVMAQLMDRFEPVDLDAWRKGWALDPFLALARSVVGQQIAGRAADAIFGRLQALIGDRDPAAAIADATDAELRAVGLSGAKAASLRDLAARTLDGRLELDRIEDLTDDEARSQLTAVRGIGSMDADILPARPARPTGRPARGRPRRTSGDPDGRWARQDADRARGPRAGRGVAPEPVPRHGLPLPLARVLMV